MPIFKDERSNRDAAERDHARKALEKASAATLENIRLQIRHWLQPYGLAFSEHKTIAPPKLGKNHIKNSNARRNKSARERARPCLLMALPTEVRLLIWGAVLDTCDFRYKHFTKLPLSQRSQLERHPIFVHYLVEPALLRASPRIRREAIEVYITRLQNDLNKIVDKVDEISVDDEEMMTMPLDDFLEIDCEVMRLQEIGGIIGRDLNRVREEHEATKARASSTTEDGKFYSRKRTLGCIGKSTKTAQVDLLKQKHEWLNLVADCFGDHSYLGVGDD